MHAEGSSFPKETGAYLHRHILPALWLEYGLPKWLQLCYPSMP